MIKQINPSILALCIILSAVIGFVISSWVIGLEGGSLTEINLLKVFRHGCEGALVGGICDFIAVRMVYETARKEFPKLRDSTANIVIKDMVKLRQKIQEASQLEDFLRDPQFQEQLIKLLQEFLPTEVVMRKEVENIWHNYLREDLIEWFLRAKFSTELQKHKENDDINQEVFRKIAAKILRQVADEEEENRILMKKIQDLTHDVTLKEVGIPAEEEAIKHLLSSIWESWKEIGGVEERSVLGFGKVSNLVIGVLASRSAPLVKKTTVQQILGPLLTEKTVREGLLAFAMKLEEQPNSSEKTNQVFEDFVGYSAVFLRAWSNLEKEEKREVLDELFRIFEGRLISHLSIVLWDIRSQLLEPTTFLRKNWVQKLLHIISVKIEENADKVEDKAVIALNEQFGSMGADGFVDMIKSRTKRQLDWIKVNGSGWGFLVGMIAGGLTLLF